ncbi:DUF3817 domain-containing protein [Streptomyces shenzhenensis]|uniref:DUF3817 domain-containing protein n=1 Tax=Streptomyces shenzhenensis TaxID=943815 RepID=UPI00367FC9FF
MNRTRMPLKMAALVELASLAVLLANLVTVHYPAIASLMGPLHGCAYLFAIGAVIRDPERQRSTVALALIPGVGASLALRQMASAGTRAEPAVVRNG